MEFKKWLTEWEGNRFDQESDLINDDKYPNSKYKGKGNIDDERKFKSKELGDIDKKFGFSKDDKLLKFNKK